MVYDQSGMEFKEGTFSGLSRFEKIQVVLGIDGQDLLREGVVKIYDGIAGSGKSSSIDSFMKFQDIEYGRYTSTNKLKRDAIARYGGNVDTIAGGLFKTDKGIFYGEFKKPKYSVIVIDEILQSDVRVFDWIQEFMEFCSVIICTDSRQMLAQDCGGEMLRKLEELKKTSIVSVLKETKRAVNGKTINAFNEYYDSVDSGVNVFRKNMKMYKKMSFNDLEFDENNVYICHTNNIENMLFHKFKLFDRYDIDLIPKGVIARNNVKNRVKYPIVPQEDAGKCSSGYFQPAMIGTPTRYQGSEVQENQVLYYLIEESSVIEPREAYTVITRMKDIDSLVLVIVEDDRIKRLNEFNKRPVKRSVWYSIPEDIEIDGVRLSDLVCDDGKIRCGSDFFKKITEGMKAPNGVHYRDSAFIFEGNIVMLNRESNDSEYTTNIYSLISKEPEFAYKYMPDFMRQFELCQYRNINRKKLDVDYLFGAMACYQESYADTPFPNAPDYVNIRGRRSYKYGIDLKSSYVHILNNAILPTGTIFSKSPGMGIDWYMMYCDQCGEGAIVTHEYKEFVEKEVDTISYFICSTGSKVGSRMGAALHKKCHKSKEDNDFVKKIKWGILDKPWIQGYGSGSTPDYYALEEQNNHQLLMLAIRSKQAELIGRITKAIYGELRHGCPIADCLYFDFDGDIVDLGNRISREIPGYDFRIFKNSEDDKNSNVVYRTYRELLSKTEIKNEKERKRRLTKKMQCGTI